MIATAATIASLATVLAGLAAIGTALLTRDIARTGTFGQDVAAIGGVLILAGLAALCVLAGSPA